MTATEINVRCPKCANGIFLEGAGPGKCSKCAWDLKADFLPAEGQLINCCALCQRRDLYQQKDFNRSLGAAVATGACLLAFGLFFWNWMAGLGVLIGIALLDLAIYVAVDSIVVCYACGAVHRGFPRNRDIPGFSLVVLDRYEKRTGGPISGGH